MLARAEVATPDFTGPIPAYLYRIPPQLTRNSVRLRPQRHRDPSYAPAALVQVRDLNTLILGENRALICRTTNRSSGGTNPTIPFREILWPLAQLLRALRDTPTSRAAAGMLRPANSTA
jgi:hypothetical protein